MVCGDEVANPQSAVLAAWTDILKINYWAIFAVAKDILAHVPTAEAARMLWRLRDTAQAVRSMGVENSHDLTGRIFQRLIADRKYLATFYTLPASAALLARLAVAKLQDVDWSDAEAIGKLRIADFACGTGALLSAVYEQIAAKHERAGGDPAALHRAMMEDVLYGCDVMPSAIHITGSTLSGVEPGEAFGSSRLYTMRYGRQMNEEVRIGSLELLEFEYTYTMLNTSDPALRTGSAGEESIAEVRGEFPHASYNLVIMNPPFTSNTKHYAAADGVLNAAFAAFDSSDRDQEDMADRLKAQSRGTSYHGHAGLGSAFASLAEKKICENGIVALVLPFTAINGASWAKFRKLIATKYTDVTVVSIAANGHAMSFSSDTGMAECLVIARRLSDKEKPSGRGVFISLRHRPRNFVEAHELTQAMLSNKKSRKLEDGPYGGNSIYCGDTIAGEMLEATIMSYENGWGAARIRDASLAQVAQALTVGKLWLPAESEQSDLPIARLKELGRQGVHHSMLVMTTHKGPFTKAPPSDTATYPSLWNHDAKKETRLVCQPDSQLIVRSGMERRAAELWANASRCHLNREFTFGSQALAIAFTEQESIGGRIWANVQFDEKSFDFAFTVWSNSTLGLLAHWWHSSRQQSSKVGLNRLVIPFLPVLDFRALSDDQLLMAELIFDEFRDKELQPAYLADADPNRALLDRRVICDLLGFDKKTYEGVRRLAAKWCAEPSVHGGKPRPNDAKLVI